MDIKLNVHGDNIVECDRLFRYVCSGLGVSAEQVSGPVDSVTCPAYVVKLDGRRILFQFLPGYGEGRWNQDIVGFVKRSGLLREAADAVLTRVEDGAERPLAAVEFCGALPAGNQAWQRHGRALSFAQAGIPYFFVAELGGFELDANRERIAPRMPNPAVPFSLLALTLNRGSVCLPVYEPNAGAAPNTINRYRSVFGGQKLREFLGLVVLGRDTAQTVADLCEKCIGLVKLLASARRQQDSLTAEEWQQAHDSISTGRSIPDFLMETKRLAWSKRASVERTPTAQEFMDLGSRYGFGLTSSSLPMSFVPKSRRAAFADETKKLYPSVGRKFVEWLANDRESLAIAWLMGFKPKGDDARPDRGLPPMVRMLAGPDVQLLTFVYGPVPVAHLERLGTNRTLLARDNGLWEAILAVSDGVLVDSMTKPKSLPHEHLRGAHDTASREIPERLHVVPRVRRLGEQDVDTALHVAFKFLGEGFVFEGMCNPPGGDWSGISFRWGSAAPEFRWLTLPRVSADRGKRPDHVFAVFGHGGSVVCLCVESKEEAHALDANIGPRLRDYVEALLDTPPSIYRQEPGAWRVHGSSWRCPDTTFASAGAYLGVEQDPFHGLSGSTGLDIQMGLEFRQDARHCVLHLRGETALGRSLVSHLASCQGWCDLVAVQVSS